MATKCSKCNGFMTKDAKDLSRCVTCEINADLAETVKGVLDGIECERLMLEDGTDGSHAAAQRVLNDIAGADPDNEQGFDDILMACEGCYARKVSQVLATVVERLNEAKNDRQAMHALFLDLDVNGIRIGG